MQSMSDDTEVAAPGAKVLVGVHSRGPTRRRLLAWIAAAPLAGCGGGEESEHGGSAQADHERARALQARAEQLGFTFSGITQTIVVDATEQHVPIGKFQRVLVAPSTPGLSVAVAPGMPANVSEDDEVIVPTSKARVLDAMGARGITLRCEASAPCTVALFLGV